MFIPTPVNCIIDCRVPEKNPSRAVPSPPAGFSCRVCTADNSDGVGKNTRFSLSKRYVGNTPS